MEPKAGRLWVLEMAIRLLITVTITSSVWRLCQHNKCMLVRGWLTCEMFNNNWFVTYSQVRLSNRHTISHPPIAIA